jgi:predicted transcriptional regulator
MEDEKIKRFTQATTAMTKKIVREEINKKINDIATDLDDIKEKLEGLRINVDIIIKAINSNYEE